MALIKNKNKIWYLGKIKTQEILIRPLASHTIKKE
jgi:hypothetical protein